VKPKRPCVWCCEECESEKKVDSCLFMHLECGAAFFDIRKYSNQLRDYRQGDMVRGKTWKRGDEPAEAKGEKT